MKQAIRVAPHRLTPKPIDWALLERTVQTEVGGELASAVGEGTVP